MAVEVKLPTSQFLHDCSAGIYRGVAVLSCQSVSSIQLYGPPLLQVNPANKKEEKKAAMEGLDVRCTLVGRLTLRRQPFS